MLEETLVNLTKAVNELVEVMKAQKSSKKAPKTDQKESKTDIKESIAEKAPESPAPAPSDEVKPLTLEDLRKVALKACRAGKKSIVEDFLKSQGVKTIPELDPKVYPAFVELVSFEG